MADIDDVVDVLSGCDMVSPFIAWIRGRMNGGDGQRILIDSYCGRSANQIRWWLTRKGVTVWNVYVAGEMIHFRIKPEQLSYAETLMRKERLPYEIVGRVPTAGPVGNRNFVPPR